uniref:RRM domain-containing protein n=1 Tax=Meloidogyne hapla TaxID=6305 RepID=A0A1I8AYH8_MELHA
MAHRPHIINGKAVDAKRAVPREKMNPIVKTEALPEFLSLELAPDCRLQLSGLNWEWHTLDTMRAHFEQFGPVEQLEMVAFPRGYGFLSFETQSAVDRCLALGAEQIVNGHPVDIKVVSPEDSLNFETLAQQTNSQNAATMTDDNCFDEVKPSSRPHSSTSSSIFESDENFNWKKEGTETKILNNEKPQILRTEEKEVKKIS